MDKNRLPIWRDASALLLETEQVVRHFPRYHKYTLGSEMRRQPMTLCQLMSRAWRDKANASKHLHQLVAMVDDFKIQCQLAKELHVFRNFAEFERLAVLSVQLGKQQ